VTWVYHATQHSSRIYRVCSSVVPASSGEWHATALSNITASNRDLTVAFGLFGDTLFSRFMLRREEAGVVREWLVAARGSHKMIVRT
jgi:hypothetical protein